MSENVQEKKSSKAIIILLIIIILLLIGGGVTALLYFNKNSGEDIDTPQETGLGLVHYDGAAVVLDEEEMGDQFQKLVEEANSGIALQFKNIAHSYDGTHFSCKIGNPEYSSYDVYYGIYLDETFQDQVLLTGLFPPGTAIEEFDSDIPFEPGEYKVVLVLTQVEDDHSTFHAQSFVNLNLIVGEQPQ